MLYRPRYCCSCGEKIEREEWRLWTSRRFCALCETEHKPYDLLPRAIVGFGIIVSLFGIGSFFRGRDTAPAKTLSQRTAATAAKLKPEVLPSNSSSGNVPTSGTNSEMLVNLLKPDPDGSGSQISEQPKKERATSDEIVFYCGAVTKKGTPCTRSVKKKGSFCWQHARAAAVAPTRF